MGKPLTKVNIDDELERNLSKYKYNLNSVLKDGEKLFLRKKMSPWDTFLLINTIFNNFIIIIYF